MQKPIGNPFANEKLIRKRYIKPSELQCIFFSWSFFYERQSWCNFHYIFRGHKTLTLLRALKVLSVSLSLVDVQSLHAWRYRTTFCILWLRCLKPTVMQDLHGLVRLSALRHLHRFHRWLSVVVESGCTNSRYSFSFIVLCFSVCHVSETEKG